MTARNLTANAVKRRHYTAAFVAGNGVGWLVSVLSDKGVEQSLDLGFGVVLIALGLVLFELAKWGCV